MYSSDLAALVVSLFNSKLSIPSIPLCDVKRKITEALKTDIKPFLVLLYPHSLPRLSLV